MELKGEHCLAYGLVTLHPHGHCLHWCLSKHPCQISLLAKLARKSNTSKKVDTEEGDPLMVNLTQTRITQEGISMEGLHTDTLKEIASARIAGAGRCLGGH